MLLLCTASCGKIGSGLSQQKVQQAVDQLLNGVRRGGAVSVQGIKQGPNEAEADIAFNNFQYFFSSAPFMGVQRFTGTGTATITHYNDGRWVLTRITFNVGDYVTGNVEIR
jgi:hypothetical protein